MPAGGELASEGDGGEGVTGFAECGEQEAARLRGPLAPQTISASSRIMRLPSPSASAIGVVMSVPTPASL